ncbi:OsmC family peroxiredoxin [Histomonas meleagridis]|uniref:OsmC family peroxiredoxin n=1 Tax=Histomonas meleagridis TaxID=135588 RepID=UPI00355A6ECB|nr:OsmC family peroxiredoxin [Histomonas meleagridis]KAH0806762.1 OsmC family peroxiredoxin [Histomonas meleagridis]
MLTSTFRRSAAEIWKTHAQNIVGSEWFCTDSQGRGIITTAGAGSAPTPPDLLLMGLGACAGNGIKFALEKRGKTVKSISVDVEGEWTNKPQRRMETIRMKVLADVDMNEAQLKAVVDEVKEKMCPVAGTLLNTPVIETTATLKK